MDIIAKHMIVMLVNNKHAAQRCICTVYLAPLIINTHSLIRAFGSRLNSIGLVKLLAEHHLEFLSLQRGCTGSSESIQLKNPHCWKSRVAAQS